jgi:26S proteasome regulatory subunit N2
MKSNEPSSLNGNILPINNLISILADNGKASSSKSAQEGEPLFEKLSNFSRVMPVQLAHITFPADGHCQPVRAILMKSLLSTKRKTVTVTPAGSKSASLEEQQ